VASLIVLFMRSTCLSVQGWFGLVSRCSIPLASQIRSKRILRNVTVAWLLGELDAVVRQDGVDLDREQLRQTQGKERYRNAFVQNRPELRRIHLCSRNARSNQVNVNKS